jgi:hypothetical protein
VLCSRRRRTRSRAETESRAKQIEWASEVAGGSGSRGTRITTVGDFFSGYPCHWQVGPFPRASLPDDDDKLLGFWS